MSGSVALASFSQKQVEVKLVALDQVVIAEPVEACAFLPLRATVFRPVAGHEIVEVRAFQRALAQREALVGAQVVYPQILRRGSGAGVARSKNRTLAFTPWL